MIKNSVLEVVSIFDGDRDAADVFADLIVSKICSTKAKENIAKQQERRYNKDAVQNIAAASGLCG